MAKYKNKKRKIIVEQRSPYPTGPTRPEHPSEPASRERKEKSKEIQREINKKNFRIAINKLEPGDQVSLVFKKQILTSTTGVPDFMEQVAFLPKKRYKRGKKLYYLAKEQIY